MSTWRRETATCSSVSRRCSSKSAGAKRLATASASASPLVPLLFQQLTSARSRCASCERELLEVRREAARPEQERHQSAERRPAEAALFDGARLARRWPPYATCTRRRTAADGGTDAALTPWEAVLGGWWVTRARTGGLV